MWIINTRPEERASAMTVALQRLGYNVLALPLLKLQALPLDAQLRNQFAEFLRADTVVVVSSIAAQLGIQHSQSLGYSLADIQQKNWIAVGQATQRTLQNFAIESICPAVENSEGMLQLPVLQQIRQQKIAFWRGIGGRTFMMEQLKQQGCDVLNMLLYHRQTPSYDQQTLTQVLTHLPAIVLISSEESWKNWLKLSLQFEQLAQTLAKQIYVVLGARVSQTIQNYFEQDGQGNGVQVLTLEQLSADAIHQRLQQYNEHE